MAPLSLYISLPTYTKQTSTLWGCYFYETFFDKFSFSYYLSEDKWKDSKIKYQSIFALVIVGWLRPKELALSQKLRICIISEKEDNAKYSQIFEHFFSWKCPFHLTFILEFPEFSVVWFRKFTNWSPFLSDFLVEWKAPLSLSRMFTLAALASEQINMADIS